VNKEDESVLSNRDLHDLSSPIVIQGEITPSMACMQGMYLHMYIYMSILIDIYVRIYTYLYISIYVHICIYVPGFIHI
jgi:hypothetical protein